MPRLLTDRATILCPHGGTGTSIAGTPYLTAMGAAVLVEGDTGTIAGCAFIQVPCVSYTLRSMGLNATKIMGKSAILETDVQLTNTGLPLIIVETGPAVDDSTPAPLPPGASSGTVPAPLADTSDPTAMVLPPVLAFNTVTQMPASVVAVFTAYHEHPMSWSLLLLNSVQGTQVDLVDGLPPAATVAPAGGTWDKAALAVTLTLTAPFMTALGITITKPHSIWFSATTQRGVTASAELQLTVT
jgi:hypothetical protein